MLYQWGWIRIALCIINLIYLPDLSVPWLYLHVWGFWIAMSIRTEIVILQSLSIKVVKLQAYAQESSFMTNAPITLSVTSACTATQEAAVSMKSLRANAAPSMLNAEGKDSAYLRLCCQLMASAWICSLPVTRPSFTHYIWQTWQTQEQLNMWHKQTLKRCAGLWTWMRPLDSALQDCSLKIK